MVDETPTPLQVLSLVPVALARAAMVRLIKPKPPVTRAVTAAYGAVLREEVLARRDQPPFPSSAMDGWAARRADLGEAPFSIAGESAAGKAYGHPLGAGEAVRIYTGAAVPEGADIVVIQEEARREDNTVWLTPERKDKDNIRPRGSDIKAGTVVLKPGRSLDPAALGLIAAAGHATIAVSAAPRVAILCTGSELAAPGADLGPDQIFESNSAALAPLASAWGAEVTVLTPEADSIEGIAKAVSGLDGLDLLVVVGGASVGDYDLAKPAVQSLGLTLAVDKVKVRPGKPTWFGMMGQTAVLGLPGNPASAFVCAHLFLKPLLEALRGQPPQDPTPLTVRLTQSLKAEGPREAYLRAKIMVDAHATLWADPSADQDSALTSVLAGANGLIRRDAAAPAAEEGERVTALLFEGRALLPWSGPHD